MKSLVISLCCVAWICLGILWLIGCGGGGGGGKPAGTNSGVVGITTLTATGAVTLPTGSKLALSSLTVNSSIDQEKINPNGSFTLKVPGAGDCVATVQDSKGDILMVGYVDGGTAGETAFAGGRGQISPTQTAAFLLFQRAGGYLAPQANWPQVLALVEGAPQTATLASTISTRMNANALAISSGDSQIAQALATATTALTGGASQAAARARAKAAKASTAQVLTVAVQSTGSSTATPTPGLKLLIQPSNAVSGITIEDSGKSDGSINFVNTYRRRAGAFIYETAVQAKPGPKLVPTPITPKPLTVPSPSPLLQLLFKDLGHRLPPNGPYEIMPSNRLNGTLGSFADIYYGSPAFAPATTGPLQLPQDGTNYLTVYTIILVGPGTNSALGTFGPWKSGPLSSYGSDWQAALSAYTIEEAVVDVIVPLIANISWGDDIDDASELDTGLLNDIANTLIGFNDLDAQYQSGNLVGVTDTFVQSALDFGTIRDEIIKALYENGSGDEGIPLVLKATDALLQLIDSSAVGGAVYISNPADEVDATLAAAAGLTPNVADVDTYISSVNLSVLPANGSSSVPYVYQWVVSGNSDGYIEAPGQSESRDVTTTNPKVLYQMGPSALPLEVDTVQVKVYLNAGTAASPVLGDLFGQASCKISVDAGCPALPAPDPGLSISNSSIDYMQPTTVTAALSFQNPENYTFGDVQWTFSIPWLGNSVGGLPTGAIIAVDGKPLATPIVVNGSTNSVTIAGSDEGGDTTTHTFTFEAYDAGIRSPQCGGSVAIYPYCNVSVTGEVYYLGVDQKYRTYLGGGNLRFNITPGSNGTGDNGGQ